MWLRTGATSLDFLLWSVALVLGLRLLTRTRIPKGLRLPPGPPGKPIIGNAYDMPVRREWERYSQWAKIYGDLVYLKVFGQRIVSVNSEKVAYDLFERRSSVYSDRPSFPMLRDLMGWDWVVTLMRYGERWRRTRKLIHQKFHPTAATEYRPVQMKHTRHLLKRLLEAPDDFPKHIRHTAGAIIMDIVYAIKVLPEGDPYVETAEQALIGATEAGIPGTFLVDMIPILKYVPEWVPGAGFQKKARIWRHFTTEMSVAPFDVVRKALKSGNADPSFTSLLLEEIYLKLDSSPEGMDAIRDAGSTLYAAGADTTVITLLVFVFAMVLYPEAQRKAQDELDKVVGTSRLPSFEDRPNLPYINAVCKEILRWHPIVPLAFAHRTSRDDIYGEYFIPEGTIVIGNTWNMLHDNEIYGQDTASFRPERFLVPGVKDPNFAFGYGRRVCPGRHMADNSVFIAVASILKVFHIAPARDSDGREIPVNEAFTSGVFSQPEPFRCAITPRADYAKKLVLQAEADV